MVWYLLLSSLIGAFTVMSSKPVSTFLLLSIEGLSTGKFEDGLAPDLLTQDTCLLSNGHGDGACETPLPRVLPRGVRAQRA